MISLSTWCRYIAHKFSYSISLSWKSYKRGQIAEREMRDVAWKNFFQGKLTYMVKEIGEQGKMLLVRKLPAPFIGDLVNIEDPENPGDYFVRRHSRLFIGDLVVLKDPENRNDHIVRRLAATEGDKIVSTDEKEEPFVLEENQCWVLSENEKLKPKEARDSRIFGPVPTSNIIGRVIYILNTAVDHGQVQNSNVSMKKDSSILEVELDVEEMLKKYKA